MCVLRYGRSHRERCSRTILIETDRFVNVSTSRKQSCKIWVQVRVIYTGRFHVCICTRLLRWSRCVNERSFQQNQHKPPPQPSAFSLTQSDHLFIRKLQHKNAKKFIVPCSVCLHLLQFLCNEWRNCSKALFRWIHGYCLWCSSEMMGLLLCSNNEPKRTLQALYLSSCVQGSNPPSKIWKRGKKSQLDFRRLLFWCFVIHTSRSWLFSSCDTRCLFR